MEAQPAATGCLDREGSHFARQDGASLRPKRPSRWIRVYMPRESLVSSEADRLQAPIMLGLLELDIHYITVQYIAGHHTTPRYGISLCLVPPRPARNSYAPSRARAINSLQSPSWLNWLELLLHGTCRDTIQSYIVGFVLIQNIIFTLMKKKDTHSFFRSHKCTRYKQFLFLKSTHSSQSFN